MQSVVAQLGLPRGLDDKITARLKYFSADDKALREALHEFVTNPRKPKQWNDTISIGCPESFQLQEWTYGWILWHDDALWPKVIHNKLKYSPFVSSPMASNVITLSDLYNPHRIGRLTVTHEAGSPIIEVSRSRP